MVNPERIDEISIGDGGIRLGQFLQVSGLLDSGGEAKEAVRHGEVSVNGEVDMRRGRQLVVGDIVTFEGRRARVAE